MIRSTRRNPRALLKLTNFLEAFFLSFIVGKQACCLRTIALVPTPLSHSPCQCMWYTKVCTVFAGQKSMSVFLAQSLSTLLFHTRSVCVKSVLDVNKVEATQQEGSFFLKKGCPMTYTGLISTQQSRKFAQVLIYSVSLYCWELGCIIWGYLIVHSVKGKGMMQIQLGIPGTELVNMHSSVSFIRRWGRFTEYWLLVGQREKNSFSHH